MLDVQEVFRRVEGRHQFLNEHLKRFEREGDRENIIHTSAQMAALRDVGRLILMMDPELCENPFEGPEDW
jgi:hypothetical protein